MKRFLFLLTALLLLAAPAAALEPLPEDAISVAAPSAVLMERSTGTVLYEKDAYRHLSPASVTKVMTMLLVEEALDSGAVHADDVITASARAASMGGSQIWLKEGEQMSVEEMLKCVTVVSANDCCVALAEHLSGSEEAFVSRMNRRAEELGLQDTHFTSCSGLTDSDEHYTCAHDLAVISRELLQHPHIKRFSTIWMDSIRDGVFGLTNTNRLIDYYPGATGLKTGYTAKARFCLSAAAERDGVEYIAVVLAAPSSAERFEDAKTLLSYGFANYALAAPGDAVVIPPVQITLGDVEWIQPAVGGCGEFLTEKENLRSLRWEVELPQTLTAPIAAGETLGTLTARAGDTVLYTLPLVAEAPVTRLGLMGRFLIFLRAIL